MKKIVICVTPNEDTYKALSNVEKHLDLSNASVTLLHSWNVQAYPLEDNHVAAFYPNKEQAVEISKKMEEELGAQSKRFNTVKPENFHVKIVSSGTPKRTAVDFLKEHQADLVVVITPSKDSIKDFFHSSFTNHLAGHAPCDLFMIRQK